MGVADVAGEVSVDAMIKKLHNQKLGVPKLEKFVGPSINRAHIGNLHASRFSVVQTSGSVE